MIIALWIVNVILALVFLAAGGMKLVRNRDALVTSGLAWTADANSAVVKGIGAIEVVGALGLVLPLLTNLAAALAPLAAVGLLLTMISATVLHLRRKESPAATAGLGAIALASAVLGFVAL